VAAEVLQEEMIALQGARDASGKKQRTEATFVAKLASAAELAGMRARGTVAMAMRAKVMSRLATTAASRRLIHLHGQRQEPTALKHVGWYADDTDSDYSVQVCRPSGPNIVNDGLKRRETCVPSNSCLGQMVKRDPGAAARHNLVVVPPWKQYTSWPPPANFFKARRQRSKALDADQDAPVGQLDNATKVQSQAKGKWGKAFSAVRMGTSLELPGGLSLESPTVAGVDSNSPTRPVALSAKSPAQRAYPSSDARKDDLAHADLNVASKLLAPEEAAQIEAVFRRYAHYGTGTQMTCKGLQLAMREVGIVAHSAQEQKRVKALQEDVLAHVRGKNWASAGPNPITDPTAIWSMEEFMLLFTGSAELEMQEHETIHQVIGDELGVASSVIRELRQIFDRVDKDESGFISMDETSNLLKEVNLFPSESELRLLLSSIDTDVDVDALTFKQFAKAMVMVDDLLAPHG